MKGAQLATDVWVGSAAKGHWEAFNRAVVLPELANGSSDTVKVRIRVVKEAASFHGATTWFYPLNADLGGNPVLTAERLTVLA